MSDWVVVYRDVHGRGSVSPALPTRETALIRARDLKRQHHVVGKIEGPDGEVVDKQEIERWVAANPE